MKTTIVLVDDHAVVRQGVRAFLEECDDLEIVGEGESGEEAVALCSEFAPDVVLLDLIMPGMDGVEATRRIKAVSPRTEIVILTSFHEDEHVFPAIKAGALSYVLKNVSPLELIQAIKKAVLREAVLHPHVAGQVLRNLREETKTETFGEFEKLTKREMEVLGLLAEGLTNNKIAEQLFISDKTVKAHIGNILGKLQLADRTQAAVYAWRNQLLRANQR